MLLTQIQEDIFRQFHACFFAKYFSIQPEQVPGKSVQFTPVKGLI